MILKSSFKPLQAPNNDEGGGGQQLTPDQQKMAAAISKTADVTPDTKPAATPKPIRSVITTPPASALEGEFTDDGAPEGLTGDEGTKQPDKKKEETPPAKKVEEPQKKAEEPPPKKDDDDGGEGQLKADGTTGGKQTVGLRDNIASTMKELGFSDEETGSLKQMSNTALELSAKVLKELKELRSKKPDSYLQHPNGYILQPEFEETAVRNQRANFEHNHWKQQLLNIRAGKTWQTIRGYTKEGEPVLDGPFKATDEAELEVEKAFGASSNIVNQTAQKLNALQSEFSSRVQADNGAIDAELAKRFEWVADQKKLDTKIDSGNPKIGVVTLKKIGDDFRSLFPSYHQGSKLLDVAANLFIALQVRASKEREAFAELERERKLKKDVLNAEPSMDGGGQQKGGKAADDIEFNLDGLPT